jgi:hypothetical protein
VYGQHHSHQGKYPRHHHVTLLQTAEGKRHPEYEQYGGNGDGHGEVLVLFVEEKEPMIAEMFRG